MRNEYSIKKVAITGGTGPIGLALIRKLLAENISILLFQRKKSAKKMYLPQHDLLTVIDCELTQLHKYIPVENNYDAFFHLGWTNTNKNFRNDLLLQNENVIHACEAVKLAHKLGCHTFIGVGSQAEYGRHEKKLSSNTVCRPDSAYGIMKFSAFMATKEMCHQMGIRHCWPRVLSAYGTYDNVESVLISTILKCINNEKELLFSEGRQIWDFVHVDDIARALFLVARWGSPDVCYPIGSGNEATLRSYLEIIGRKFHRENEMQFGVIPYSDKQIMYLAADVSEITKDVGWTPNIGFEEGISKTIEFYKYWNREIKDSFYKTRIRLEGW